MLNENIQRFINFFINTSLVQNNDVFNDCNNFDIVNNIDEILTKIHLASQFKNFTSQQILKQLILKASYNYPYACNQLLSVYNKDYVISNTYSMWQIWKNLYKNINGKQYSIYNFYICYLNCFMNITKAIDKYKCKHYYQHVTIDEKDIYFSFLKDFDNNQLYDLQYRLKNIIVTSHKLFYLSSDWEKYKIFFPKLFLSYYQFFIPYFNFLQKDLKLFINIFIDVLIKTFDILHKYPQRLCNDVCLWSRMFDLVFSNWYLLKDKYKKYLKKHGKEIIVYFIEKNRMSKSHEQENKKIFFQLIDKLSL